MPTIPVGLTKLAFDELRKASNTFSQDLHKQAAIIAGTHSDSDDKEISITDVRRARDVLCARNLFTKHPKLASSIAGFLGSAGFLSIGLSTGIQLPQDLSSFLVVCIGGALLAMVGLVVQIVH